MSAAFEKFISIAGVVIVALALVSALFFGLNKATGFLDKAYAKIDNMSVSVEESDYTKYEGAIVSGTEVIAAIKYFQSGEPICIEVNNGYSTTNYVYADESLSTVSTETIANAQNKRDLSKYINPTGKYLGSIVRDSASDLIVAVKFDIQTP